LKTRVSGSPFLLVLAGYSGSGKTTLAAHLSDKFKTEGGEAIGAMGAVVIESDPVRKALCGLPPEARLGAEGYTHEMTQKVIAEMNRQARAALTAGQNVIMAAVLDTRESRRDKEKLAAECGADFCGIWLDVPEAVLLDRVEKRAAANTDASDAGVEIVKQQLAAARAVNDWPKINAARDIDAVLADILSQMENRNSNA